MRPVRIEISVAPNPTPSGSLLLGVDTDAGAFEWKKTAEYGGVDVPDGQHLLIAVRGPVLIGGFTIDYTDPTTLEEKE